MESRKEGTKIKRVEPNPMVRPIAPLKVKKKSELKGRVRA